HGVGSLRVGFGGGGGDRRLVNRLSAQRRLDGSGSEGFWRKAGDADTDIFAFAVGDLELSGDAYDGEPRSRLRDFQVHGGVRLRGFGNANLGDDLVRLDGAGHHVNEEVRSFDRTLARTRASDDLGVQREYRGGALGARGRGRAT